MTGEQIGDSYFEKLHALRNDTAQNIKRGVSSASLSGKNLTPPSSTDGCESVSNDKRKATDATNGGSCEAI